MFVSMCSNHWKSSVIEPVFQFLWMTKKKSCFEALALCMMSAHFNPVSLLTPHGIISNDPPDVIPPIIHFWCIVLSFTYHFPRTSTILADRIRSRRRDRLRREQQRSKAPLVWLFTISKSASLFSVEIIGLAGFRRNEVETQEKVIPRILGGVRNRKKGEAGIPYHFSTTIEG